MIHLVRDFNQDILANPWYDELKSVASTFGGLLKAVGEKGRATHWDGTKFDEHPAGRARVQERDKAIDATARCAIDELYLLGCEAVERARKVAHLEAEVVHGRASALTDVLHGCAYKNAASPSEPPPTFAQRPPFASTTELCTS